MGITYGDHLIDSGYYDITPGQEREADARAECVRRGVDPDEVCADGGVPAWAVVAQEIRNKNCNECRRVRIAHCSDPEHCGYDQCPKCGGDCSTANPPIYDCPMVGCNKDF